MAGIRITIDGLADLLAALEEVKSQVDLATREATKQSGERLQSDARHNFIGYHAPGFWHVGGDKPNAVTGTLQASILTTPVVESGPHGYTTRVGPTAIYGRIIELGGPISAEAKSYLSWFDAQSGPHGYTTRVGPTAIYGRIFDAQMGVQRYKRRVYIPPRPYFSPAYLVLPPKMYEIFATEWGVAWTYA